MALHYGGGRAGHMSPFLPEVTSSGLVLWRLRRSPVEQYWCSVCDQDGELVLTLRNPASSGMTVSETHADVGTLVDRAERLRQQFCSAGWVRVDIDFDELD